MKMPKPLSADAALDYARDLCARAEYAPYEVRQRLFRRGLPTADIDKIIDLLIDERYLDEERFARAFSHSKVEYAGWGRRKIAAALAQKRIPAAIITDALASIDPKIYIARLQAVIAAARRRDPEPDTYQGRTRIFRHAASRGFEPDIIARFLRQNS